MTSSQGYLVPRQSHRLTAQAAGKRPEVDASIGVGYALDQEFTRGYDIRHPRSVVTLSEEPFASIKVQGTF